MQASVYGKRGILPALSRALHLESGILGKYRLSFADDFTVVFDDFLLAIFISWSFHQIDSTVRKKFFIQCSIQIITLHLFCSTAYNFSHFCLNLFYLNFLYSAFEYLPNSSQSRQSLSNCRFYALYCC